MCKDTQFYPIKRRIWTCFSMHYPSWRIITSDICISAYQAVSIRTFFMNCTFVHLYQHTISSHMQILSKIPLLCMLSRRVKFHVFHVKTFGSVRLLNGAQRKGIETRCALLPRHRRQQPAHQTSGVFHVSEATGERSYSLFDGCHFVYSLYVVRLS